MQSQHLWSSFSVPAEPEQRRKLFAQWLFTYPTIPPKINIKTISDVTQNTHVNRIFSAPQDPNKIHKFIHHNKDFELAIDKELSHIAILISPCLKKPIIFVPWKYTLNPQPIVKKPSKFIFFEIMFFEVTLSYFFFNLNNFHSFFPIFLILFSNYLFDINWIKIEIYLTISYKIHELQ